MNDFQPTDRTRLRRHPERGTYDRRQIHALLDEALVCHLSFVHEGQPYGIPTMHARQADTLYIHGAAPGRMLQTLSSGGPVCVTVTLLDGLVLAKSAFNHSMNYRSVMVLGEAYLVTEIQEKLTAMSALVERMAPGRWAQCRQPTAQEIAATAVVRISLDEASAKIRSGPPTDNPADLDWPVWAGVVPISTVVGAPRDSSPT